VSSLLGVPPHAGTQFNQRALANLARGELLCQAFELYQQLMPSHGISFEHAVFLVTAVARGVELTVGRCAECGVLGIVNRLDRASEYCTDARRQSTAIAERYEAHGAPPIRTEVTRVSLLCDPFWLA
jgi:hypothetical protein